MVIGETNRCAAAVIAPLAGIVEEMKELPLKTIAVALAVAAPFIFVRNRTEARHKRQLPTQAPSQEKPVEQVFKNIRVLNGMPQSQLYPAMAFFVTSLNVDCNYCHVSNNQGFNFAADDKTEKLTARNMIKMVREINRTYVQADSEVSCYTCHRGRTSPQGFPILPLPLPASRTLANGVVKSGNALGPSANSSTTEAAPPSAADVLKKYFDAIGGESAAQKISSCVITGTTASANGQPVPYEADQVAPDKGYQAFAFSAIKNERAVIGDNGWSRNSDGVQELTGEQIGDTKLLFPLFINLRIRDQYSRMRVSGRDKIDDRDVWVLSAVRFDGKNERLYFDLENGLLRRRISFTPTMIGIIPQQTDFEDYRNVQGVKFPFVVRTSYADSRSPFVIRKFDEIKLNVTVDESKFKKPSASRR